MVASEDAPPDADDASELDTGLDVGEFDVDDHDADTGGESDTGVEDVGGAGDTDDAGDTTDTGDSGVDTGDDAGDTEDAGDSGEDTWDSGEDTWDDTWDSGDDTGDSGEDTWDDTWDSGEDTGDSGEDTGEEEPIVVPPRGTITEYHSHVAQIPSEPFDQATTRYYRTEVELGGAIPRVLRVFDYGIWLGTDQGLMLYDEDADEFLNPFENLNVSVDRMGDERWFESGDRSWPGVYGGKPGWFFDGDDSLYELNGFEFEARDVVRDTTWTWVASGAGLWRTQWGDTWERWTLGNDFDDREIHALTVVGTQLFVASDDGLWVFPRNRLSAEQILPGMEIVDVESCHYGSQVVAVSEGSIFLIDPGDLTNIETLNAGPRGLASWGNQRVSCGTWENNALAIHRDSVTNANFAWDGSLHYRFGRWMLGHRLIGAAFYGDDLWIATEDGVTRIAYEYTDLYDKADELLGNVLNQFIRPGGIVAPLRSLSDWFELDDGTLEDSPQDGLWTQWLVGTLSYAYGTTGNNDWCETARAVLDAAYKLSELPCASFDAQGKNCGFIASSFIREDDSELFGARQGQPGWTAQELGDIGWLWRGGTGVADIAAHGFGFSFFHDLCASPAEQARISGVFQALTDSVLDNDFALVDLDGAPTPQGQWGPAQVSSCLDGYRACVNELGESASCESVCDGEGYFAAVQLLGQLLFTWHLTGEDRYYIAYENLIRKHHYDAVILTPLQWPLLSDFERIRWDEVPSLFIAFQTLIRYEPNSDRRGAWQEAMDTVHELVGGMENPLTDALLAGVTGTHWGIPWAIWALEGYPMDLRNWPVDNSTRLDLEHLSELDYQGYPQCSEPLSIRESGVLSWEQSPVRTIHGRVLTQTNPLSWLTAYWALNYYELFQGHH